MSCFLFHNAINLALLLTTNMFVCLLLWPEFARDEQLLRGREGYSLVTLQAALHYLNSSSNFESDIFGQSANLELEEGEEPII